MFITSKSRWKRIGLEHLNVLLADLQRESMQLHAHCRPTYTAQCKLDHDITTVDTLELECYVLCVCCAQMNIQIMSLWLRFF